MLNQWLKGLKFMGRKSYDIEKNTGLSPLAKEYIKLVVTEQLSGVQEEIKAVFSELKVAISSTDNGSALNKRMDDIVSKIDYLEKRYKEDDKFTLTKAKMINFIEEQDIK